MSGVTILEVECCPDHVLMLLPPKMCVSGFVGYLKGKSSLMLYERFGELNSNTAIVNSGAGATTWIR